MAEWDDAFVLQTADDDAGIYSGTQDAVGKRIVGPGRSCVAGGSVEYDTQEIEEWGNHMTYQFPSDVQQLVRERMASGKYASEDEMLREALQALAEEEQDLEAVREAMAEWRAGDAGLPLDEAFDSVRANHDLAQDA
jgi:putative addiction module CopG family antidote